MERDAPIVSSVHNRWVKYARSLERRKARLAEGAFLVEGARLVEDGLATGATPTIVFHDVDSASASATAVAARAVESGARLVPVTSTVMRAVADTETPQGIVAVFPLPNVAPRTVAGIEPLFLTTDAIRDPGNLGTLIRSAAAAGVDAIFVGPGTVDPFAPKVVRAGMGAHFRVAIRHVDWTEPDPVLVACRQRLAASADATLAYDAVDWTRSSCLIVGNEASGVSADARRFATGTVAIPLATGVESLNAAVAGSVVLFEAARQRRRQELPPTSA